MTDLLPKNVRLLEKMLDYTALRQRVISNNIANINTPGFKQSEVNFQGELIKAIKNGDDVSDIRPEVVKPDIAVSRADGNNVDIDKEMGKLTENALLYKIYAQLISRRLRGLREAIEMSAKV